MTLYNLVRMYTATTGTDDIVVTTAVAGYKDCTDVPNGASVTYSVFNVTAGAPTDSEIGHGTWNSATQTIARTTVLASTNSNAKIVLTGSGQVALTLAAEDITAETASSILTKLLTVDGTGSLLDADFLDGQSGAYYAAASALHDAATVSDTTSLNLSITGQEISGAVNFGTGAGVAAEGNHAHSGTYSELYVDTKANVIAATKTAGQVGYATDTYELYISLGGGTWRVIPFPTLAESGIDMGIPNENNRLGYGDDYISDKSLNQVTWGTTAVATEGGMWIDPSTTSPRKLYVRLNSTNNTVIIDFSVAAGYLVHYPFSSTQAVKVWSGMSTQVGLNSRPTINEYEVDMGAYPAPRILNGGTF